MKVLITAMVLLAAAYSISCKEMEVMKCMQENGMTPEKVKAIMSPNHKPDPECLLFLGCVYTENKDIWENMPMEEGSKQADALNCIKKITETDQSKIGDEVFKCCQESGLNFMS